MDVALLAALLAAFILVSALEWAAMELAALALLVALVLTGILTAEEALEGFASPVVLAIAGLFVLNTAVERSGLLAWAGGHLAATASRRPRGALSLLLVLVGALSMFISNVATTALLVPAVISACRRAKVSPSRFLMPLAFASLVGGMATLIGATGNLIVQGLAVRAGARPFGFFEFAWIGLPLFALTLVYLVTVGWRLVPARRTPTEGASDPLRGYLVEMTVPDRSKLVGRSVADAALRARFGLTLLAIRRGRERIVPPGPRDVFAAGDHVIVEGEAEQVAVASASGELGTEHDRKVTEADVESAHVHLYEVLVPPRSEIEGETAKAARLRQRWGVTLLAVLRRGRSFRTRPENVRIRAGDELLVQGAEPAMEAMQEEGNVIVLGRAERGELNLRAALPPAAILAGVVALAVAGTLPLAISVLLGVVVLLVARVMTTRQALRSLDLRVVVVVACVLPLGRAVETTGAAEILADALGRLDGVAGPWAVLAALFVATSALTQVVQKAAIAVAVPLALAAAQATGSDPAPFLMAVAVAGSCAFLTPLAHPVNLIVQAPGHFRFGDFARVGLPLQALVTAGAVAGIPLLWPFDPS